MLFCSTPTFPVLASRYIQNSIEDNHEALIDEIVKLTLLSPYEVLDTKYINALHLYSASNKLDYNLDITLSEEIPETGIVLMYIRSLLNQVKNDPILLKILVIIGRYMRSNSDVYTVDSKGFYEIVNQASIHGITDIFSCFNKLASISLDFQVLDFIDGKVVKSKPIMTPLFHSFELASNSEISNCIENPLFEGDLLKISFTSIIDPIIKTVICNPESLILNKAEHEVFFDTLVPSKVFS
jgi:hypothetical protein